MGNNGRNFVQNLNHQTSFIYKSVGVPASRQTQARPGSPTSIPYKLTFYKWQIQSGLILTTKPIRLTSYIFISAGRQVDGQGSRQAGKKADRWAGGKGGNEQGRVAQLVCNMRNDFFPFLGGFQHSCLVRFCRFPTCFFGEQLKVKSLEYWELENCRNLKIQGM